MKIKLLILFVLASISISAQDIELNNPSFEGIPAKGVRKFYLIGWFDSGSYIFPYETAPDVHPIKGGLWGNIKAPQDGTSYVGMVVRDNDTYESISQKLDKSMQGGQCYSFSISIAKNNVYLSGSRKKQEMGVDYNPNDTPFTTPIVLRIWGGNKYGEEAELLAESNPVDHNDWMNYSFNLKPSKNYRHITLSAFYKVPTLETYNGHILIDNASTLKAINCPDSNDIFPVAVVNVDENPKDNIAVTTPKKTIPKKKRNQPKAPKIDQPKAKKDVAVIPPVPEPNVVPIKKAKKPQPKINIDLGQKIKKGQVIKMRKLFFKENASDIERSAYASLDELYYFLEANPSVSIEVGGHTNGIPGHNFCDQLSQKRANEVAQYLIDKGISSKRINPVGYGKRKPIASNETIVGRRRNQRVEIKILDL